MSKQKKSFTIKDLAKIAGVSTATVSRALSGKCDINEQTRERILQLAADYHFTPNAIGRGLSLQKTFTLGVVIPDITSSYFPEVFRGVEDVASENGYSIVYLNTDYKIEKERESLMMLKTGRVDGLIALYSNRIIDECRAMVDMGYPIVLIGNALESVICPCIACNNLASAYTIVEYLIHMGHKKIAHISGNRDTKTGILRIQGYMSALENYGIPVRPEWNLATHYFKEEAYLTMKQILNSSELPTAVFAANDTMAIGCYNAIYEAGLKIPDDISIVGHDDIEVAAVLSPPLTTMRQQKREIGRIAARKILDYSAQGDNDITILPTELVERKSVKKLN